tara:strand:+ start:127 stop:657 length:531 start_codon:yes stop_codon:yes gene_type:complete
MIYSKNKEIGIRAIEKTDLALIKSWRNNELLRQYFREYRDFSMTQKENWYNDMITNNKFEMFVIKDCVDNQDIGVTGITYIDWVNRHGDVHFYIGKNGEWIDEKYSPEAIKLILDYGFKTLNLNKLWAEIYEIDNKKLDFFKSLGFNIDASLREHYFHNGKYYTSHILSLLRSEYE